jgi:hypothetical protein
MCFTSFLALLLDSLKYKHISNELVINDINKLFFSQNGDYEVKFHNEHLKIIKEESDITYDYTNPRQLHQMGKGGLTWRSSKSKTLIL